MHCTGPSLLQAIGARNAVKSVTKQRDVERLKIQSQCAEYQAQLER